MKTEPPTSAPVRKGRSVKSNFLKLLGGRGVTAVLTLGATILTAKALMPADFGIVIMIHAFLLLVQGLVKLSAFDAIITFGVPEQEAGNTSRVAQLIRSTWVLDIGSALLGTLLALLICPLIGPHIGWDVRITHLAMFYSLLLFSGLTGTANGVLRLFDRFDLLVRASLIDRILRLAGVALCWYFGSHDVALFLAAYGLSWLASNLYLLYAGWKQYRLHLPGEALFKGDIWEEHRKRFPGFWRFLHVVYWQSNLDMIPKHVAVLFAGFFLGPALAGMYRLAFGFSKALAVPALLLRKVLLGDLARLWHRRDPGFTGLLYRSLAGSAGVGLVIAAVVWFYAVPLLTLVAGPGYSEAAPALTWLMLAAGLSMGTSTLRAAAYAMEKANKVLKIHAYALIVYVVSFPLLTPALGLAGAGMASAATSLVTLIAMILLVKGQLSRLKEDPPSSADAIKS